MNIFAKKNYLLEINKKITLTNLIKKLNVKNENIDKMMLNNIDFNEIINFDLLKDVLNKLNYYIVEEFDDPINKLYISKKIDSYNNIRSLIVSLIGHVDSGKTSILDLIECTNFSNNEIGGITQYIRSFKKKIDNKDIIFIDTPGHESFIEIRKNCIEISDLLILVISVDDLLKNNNIIDKFINEVDILNINIKLIVVINKIDKINNINEIKNKLNNYIVLFKNIDIDYKVLYLSVKHKKNIDMLIDNIKLKFNIINLKYNINNIAYGIVIESFLDKNVGYTAKLIIKDGLINIGDLLLFNTFFYKIRLIIDENNIKVKSSNPSNIIKIFGLSSIPKIGEKFILLNEIKKIKNILTYRNIINNKNKVNTYIDKHNIDFSINKKYNLNYIIKTNTISINDAILYSINKLLNVDYININIISIKIGDINKNDIYMALNSNSELLGFNIKINSNLLLLINKFNIKYNNYLIIYDLINHIENSIKNICLLKDKENIKGNACVINTFNVNKLNIIGCKLNNGFFNKFNNIKIFRNNILIYIGSIYSMKNFKNDIVEANNNMEFCITINDKNILIKKGDKIISFK